MPDGYINRQEVLYVACRLAAADIGSSPVKEEHIVELISERSVMYAQAAIAIIKASGDAAKIENESYDEDDE